MRVRLFLTAAIILGIGRGVLGQASTADGVAALARGDYQRAVEILKPIAEDWRSIDTAAQFFMAGLYETGRGVPTDPLRACALYARAASYDTPFGHQAAALFGAVAGRSREFNQECQRLALVGFDNGFEPAMFDLGPGHFVEWTLAGASVTYDGRTKRHELGLAMPGARYLALHHTELLTGPTRSARRHFTEMFVWLPSGNAWELHWHIFEIVRDEIIRIDTPAPLISTDAIASAARDAFEVRRHAVLRVDDEGNAEWAVLQGRAPKTERIESDAERQEVRQTALTRDAALKKIDWSRRTDVNRHPTLAYVDGDGCGHVRVYGWTADRAEAVVVTVDGSKLSASAQSGTFDLSRQSAIITVEAHVYAAPQQRFYFCSDVNMPESPDSIETWRAVAGTITIELFPPGIRARTPHLRRATITLTNLVLRNSAGTTVTLPRLVRVTGIVGSMAG